MELVGVRHDLPVEDTAISAHQFSARDGSVQADKDVIDNNYWETGLMDQLNDSSNGINVYDLVQER